MHTKWVKYLSKVAVNRNVALASLTKLHDDKWQEKCYTHTWHSLSVKIIM